MNFYQHHIGDFNNATRHLTRIERSIYRDLLELYYDTEKPLTSDFDRLARRCLVDDSDRAAMRDVLNEFFTLSDDGYHNSRADREIAAYKRMAEGGKRGAEKRWGKGDDSPPIATPLPPHTKANANHEPETINHEPIKTSAPKNPVLFDPRDLPMPLGLKAAKWDEWVSFRKKLPRAPKRETWEKQIEFIAKQIANGADAASIIDYSIRNGYTGLFEQNAARANQTTQKGQTRHEQLAEHTAILTGQHRRQPAYDPTVIHGTAERLD